MNTAFAHSVPAQCMYTPHRRYVFPIDYVFSLRVEGFTPLLYKLEAERVIMLNGLIHHDFMLVSY